LKTGIIIITIIKTTSVSVTLTVGMGVVDGLADAWKADLNWEM